MLNLIDRRVIFFTVRLLALAMLLGGGLTACGKKPGHVDPPPGVPEDNFPRVYPDPATDPKPVPAQ